MHILSPTTKFVCDSELKRFYNELFLMILKKVCILFGFGNIFFVWPLYLIKRSIFRQMC